MTTSSTAVSGPDSVEWSRNSDHSIPNGPLTASKRVRYGSLGVLLALTGALYVWRLGAAGYANDFYAAAVQAGTQSWQALFFGSFDASNFITVDKPPAALWPMEISGRLFGFNSWSMLVPQAIEGVLTVWVLYSTVKRWFGHWAAIMAGALMAITPVAVLMFRFNNPDALMVLLIVVAAYCVTRAIEGASTRWLVLAGLVLGFSFLAKGLQPFTVLPAFVAAYVVAAPASWKRRIVQLLVGGAAVVVGAGWWVLAVQLTPASSRPYIGGSGNNSALGLAFGYNGLSRLSGGNGPGGGGPGGGGGFDGNTGIGRMFNSLNGGQIAWLLPTALVAIVTLVVVTRRAPLTDRTRAATIIWGGWLLVTGAVLSFAGGIIHTYYTVELAPAVAALVAVGTAVLWRMRRVPAARVGLAVGAVLSGIWGYTLLHRTPTFYSWVGYLLIVVGIAVAALLLLQPGVLRRGPVLAMATAGFVVLGGGSAAYALNTAANVQDGTTPSAGPSTRGGFLGGPGGGAGAFPGGPGGGNFPGAPPGTGARGEFGSRPGRVGGGSFGGPGGRSQRVDTKLTALLKKTHTTWAAATIASMSAAPLQLASGRPVMAIGGFSGSDAAPSLQQFQAYVREGKIAYFVSSDFGGPGGSPGGGSPGAGADGGPGSGRSNGSTGPGGGRSTGSAITRWVQANYTAKTVGNQTVYDLSEPKS